MARRMISQAARDQITDRTLSSNATTQRHVTVM
jgi:hypothetical protein